MKSFVNIESSLELHALSKEVEFHLPRSAMIYNVIKLKQALISKPSEKVHIQIYTFLLEGYVAQIKIQGLPQSIFVIFTTNEPSSQFLECLHNVIDWTIPIQFEGVETSVANFLVEYNETPCRWELHDPIELHYMLPEKALQLPVPRNDKFNLSYGSLEPNDAVGIDDVWQASCPGSLELLSAGIELVGSGGVQIHNRNNKMGNMDKTLVSWAVGLPFGSIHALHTKPEYQGHGYAKMTMQCVSKNIAEKGRLPIVQIYKSNDASKHLNSKIGFIYSHDINLMHYYPN